MDILSILGKSKTARRLTYIAMLATSALPGCGGSDSSSYISKSGLVRPGTHGHAIKREDGSRHLKLSGKSSYMIFESSKDGSFILEEIDGGNSLELESYRSADSAEVLYDELIGQ